MFCESCGRELTQDSAFCPFCGEKVAARVMEVPVYQTDVRRLMKPGWLFVFRDRTEFVINSVQKTVFYYANLSAVKKEWDHIDFFTADGRKESCPADAKCVHEAFLYIEQLVRPYLAQRQRELLAQGIRYSFPSSQGMIYEGILNITSEQMEFRDRSGRNDVIFFRDVKSVSAPAGTLDLVLFDRRTKSFTVSREQRDEVLAFVAGAVAPYLAQRKAELLSRGIHFSFFAPDGGTVDVLADRVERRSQTGQVVETIPFCDVRTSNLRMETLELALTDGTSRVFMTDAGAGDEVLSFVRNAIEPYVRARTEGFDTAFGIDERIEINKERGVFHIIRQSGREIAGEWPLEALSACRWEERKELNALGKVMSGGIALIKSAARATGNQNVTETEERLSSAGVILTIGEGQEARTECVWFGFFPTGMSRTNKKYERYLAEWAGLSNYLRDRYPECEQTGPAPVESEPQRSNGMAVLEPNAASIPQEAGPGEEAAETAGDVGGAAQQDDLGIAKYIEGVSRFIGSCKTPMTIAVQGNRGSGENSVLRILFNRLRGGNHRLWLDVRQLSQDESGDALIALVGKKLAGLFGDGDNAAGKGSDIITNLAGLLTGMVADDSSIGKEMVGGLFNRRQSDPTEQFAELAAQKAGTLGTGGKVVLFVDGLDWMAPARTVEVLEAMRAFFACKGCVFVIAIDYSTVLDGIRERYGQGFDEERARTFFAEMFKMSFRVPASSYNVTNYVKNKLERLGIQAEDETELELCVSLIHNSVGKDLESIDRLFTSFQLITSMTDEELYKVRYNRLVLFALLCMQTGFRRVYECLVQRRDSVTPEFLAGLCGLSARPWSEDQVSDEEAAAFQDFGSVFARIINLDGDTEISEAECRAFAEVLEFSSITST